MSRKIALERDSPMNTATVNIKTKIKPSNKNKSGPYSWRNMARSRKPHAKQQRTQSDNYISGW
jgi:hypothetical protein